jgi:hypothetical protein
MVRILSQVFTSLFSPPNPQKSAQKHESYAAYKGYSNAGWCLIGGLRGGCLGILFRHAFLVLLHRELDDLGQVQGAAVRGLGDLFATIEAIGEYLPLQHLKEQAGTSTGTVLFFTGDHVAGAHGAAIHAAALPHADAA